MDGSLPLQTPDNNALNAEPSKSPVLYSTFFVRARLTQTLRGYEMIEESTSDTASNSMPECFVIMPISDSDPYEKGHFGRVYEDLFKPACEQAGYAPLRGDEVTQTNLIHLDILQRLVESPMAICDLSSRNPNVLFELGLRQAFDRPTVLVQEKGTPKIFDIAPLRYVEYRQALKYREVLQDQVAIADAIRSTKKATDEGDGINSLVGLLSIAGPATLKDPSETDAASIMRFMRAEMEELRSEVRYAMNRMDRKTNSDSVRYSSRALDECQALIDGAEQHLLNGEYKRGYDSINSAQRKLHRLLSGDKRVGKRTMVEADRMMARSMELEKIMSVKSSGDSDAT